MPEKRMLIVDTDLLTKIDENRGDMSRSEFIDFLIDSNLVEDSGKQKVGKQNYITREEFSQAQQGIKELLHSFLEFFINYGLEVGKPENKNFDELVQKLGTPENKAKHP
jgi:metal-responsive CopG/Arc/MetJ family transcriptional regulator